MESAPTVVELTPSQRAAVKERGNVLVVAGAGTGKTKTLVERCLDCLGRDGAAINELLIVTFTEAAAAEMRGRLRRAMEARAGEESPGLNFWAGQLALFDLAHIGTLHSFCLRLVREHFYELGLDPQFTLLDEGEARQRAGEILDEQFKAHYEGKTNFSADVRNLVQIHGGGRDEKIRALILRLHHYSQTRPGAAAWLAAELEKFSTVKPFDWQRWLPEAVQNWRDEWLSILETLNGENEKALELTRILQRLPKNFSRDAAAEMLAQILAADEEWPLKRKTALRKPVEKFFDETAFLKSLAVIKNGGADPLAEDWSWVRGDMATLLRLAQEFAARFAENKLRGGVMDFHDLEQFALKLLWDFPAGKPAAAAEAWRGRLKFVFVDEYQDINAAQDKIIEALARDDAHANRFLVGDVKQSIYRFRLADPKIFRGYARKWRGKKVIPLSENFRSRPELLDFVNSLFRTIMREEVGGVKYDADAELKFPKLPGAPGAEKISEPRVELLLRLKAGRNEIREENDELADLDETQKEARVVAARLRQFIAEGHTIYDVEKKISRRAGWSDVAVLLRAPRGKSEIFAREFERAKIPLAVARGKFYENSEVLDLLNLLQLLDNPLQDVPCIAVLRSPLGGFSLDDLAEIRLTVKDGHFWTALNAARNKNAKISSALREKVAAFLERFSRWRKLAQQVSLSQCFEEILAETLYADWLRAQPQRAANLASLRRLAQKFDLFQRQGLFRFLKFIEAQQDAEAEPEVPAAATENAVRLMSIHQSKGLEFPVVVLPDLAKNFNEQDLRADIIFDEEFGLCPKIKPPSSGRRYPSLPHWLAQRRQQRELRGEELRLLYVALTRARDHLVLTASVTGKNWTEKWNVPQPVNAHSIAGAKSFAGWLSLWFSNQTPPAQGRTDGCFENLRWRVMADADAAMTNFDAGKNAGPDILLAGADLEKFRRKLEWNYPKLAATRHTAKSSVTELRRAAEELDDEAEQVFTARRFFPPAPTGKATHRRGKLSAGEIGAAHHKFLEHVALDQTGDIRAEAERLARENYLSADERAALDLDALENFWGSELGQKIRGHAALVRRELPFTARFRPAEIDEITGGATSDGLEDEFVVVQGVADLAVFLPGEIWLVDFKTDAVRPEDLPAKLKMYAPQLKLYAAALEKIFGRKVTRRALHFLAAGATREI